MNSKSAKEKLAERYKLKIPKTRGNDWLQAIEEADQALGVPEHDRQRTFFSPEVKLKKEMDRKKRKENEALIKNESEESNKVNFPIYLIGTRGRNDFLFETSNSIFT